MPSIRLTDTTMALIRSQTTPGYRFHLCATKGADGLWTVAIDDDVAIHVAEHRLEGETDDDVVARLVRAALGLKPS